MRQTTFCPLAPFSVSHTHQYQGRAMDRSLPLTMFISICIVVAEPVQRAATSNGQLMQSHFTADKDSINTPLGDSKQGRRRCLHCTLSRNAGRDLPCGLKCLRTRFSTSLIRPTGT